MIISKKKFNALSEEDKNKLKYSNPCATSDKKKLRVGEVFDSDLGYWRPAKEDDF